MIVYTFRINELNVFFYQQIMQNFEPAYDKKSINAEDEELLAKDPHTDYSRYVMDNYGIISFKVAIGVAAINLKIPEAYEWITGKLGINDKLKEWNKNINKKLKAWRKWRNKKHLEWG